LIGPVSAEFSDLAYTDGKVGAFGNKGLFTLVRNQIVEIGVLEKGRGAVEIAKVCGIKRVGSVRGTEIPSRILP
jgi:hypothetical protein